MTKTALKLTEAEIREKIEKDPSILDHLPYLYRRELIRLLDLGDGKTKTGKNARQGTPCPANPPSV
jgi:hypothetical protein